MKSYWKKTGLQGLVPDDEISERIYNRAMIGDIIEADAKIPKDQRSLKQNRLYFKMLDVVFNNLPERYANEIATQHQLRMRILLRIGFTEFIPTGTGVHEIPRSIDFRVGQDEFHREVWKPTVDLIETVLIPGIDRKELEREYYELMGVPA